MWELYKHQNVERKNTSKNKSRFHLEAWEF